MRGIIAYTMSPLTSSWSWSWSELGGASGEVNVAGTRVGASCIVPERVTAVGCNFDGMVGSVNDTGQL